MRFTRDITSQPKGRERAAKLAGRLLCLMLALSLLPVSALASAIPTTIRVAMVVSKDMELYPLRVMDRDAVSIFSLVYESLFKLDDNREPQPSLVSSWEILSDGRTWLFTIRDNIYFHDGRKLTAYDVKATMDAIKTIANDSSLASNEKGLYCVLPDICQTWEADDERTLRIRTNERSYYGLLYALTFPVLQAQSVYSENPPGTGPYRIEYYLAGDQIWLEGNVNWWDQPPYVSEIIGVWYENDASALKGFDAEEVDILMTRSTDAIRYRGTASSRISSYDYATRQLECLMINNYVSALRDVRMRKAIIYAIDKSRLVNGVYQDMVTRTDTLQSPASWLYNGNAFTYGYNVDAANALLDDLGWTSYNADGYRIKKTDTGDVELSFNLNYYDEAGSTLRKEAANQIATMLRAIGIRIKISAASYEDAARNLVSGNYNLYLCAYNFDVTPDPNFIFTGTKADGNYAAYNSADMKTLCQRLRKAYKREDFQSIWFEIQELMAQEVPFIPLYWREGIILTRYPYSTVRDIREYELLDSIEKYR